jgi:hypothetical protein
MLGRTILDLALKVPPPGKLFSSGKTETVGPPTPCPQEPYKDLSISPNPENSFLGGAGMVRCMGFELRASHLVGRCSTT